MRILFQGDSITDCLRSSYDSGAFVGSGYPCLIQADLCLNRTDIEVLNCGISGNRVTNLHNTIIKQAGKKSRRKTDVDRRKNCAAVNLLKSQVLIKRKVIGRKRA